MNPRNRVRNPLTRFYTSVWVLVGLAVLMAGTVNISPDAAPSPLTLSLPARIREHLGEPSIRHRR